MLSHSGQFVQCPSGSLRPHDNLSTGSWAAQSEVAYYVEAYDSDVVFMGSGKQAYLPSYEDFSRAFDNSPYSDCSDYDSNGANASHSQSPTYSMLDGSPGVAFEGIFSPNQLLSNGTVAPLDTIFHGHLPEKLHYTYPIEAIDDDILGLSMEDLDIDDFGDKDLVNFQDYYARRQGSSLFSGRVQAAKEAASRLATQDSLVPQTLSDLTKRDAVTPDSSYNSCYSSASSDISPTEASSALQTAFPPILPQFYSHFSHLLQSASGSPYYTSSSPKPVQNGQDVVPDTEAERGKSEPRLADASASSTHPPHIIVTCPEQDPPTLKTRKKRRMITSVAYIPSEGILSIDQSLRAQDFKEVVGGDKIRAASIKRRINEPVTKCEICGATFTAPHNLDNHMNSHFGRRPFACRYCDKRFGTPSTATRHTNVCTNNPAAKPKKPRRRA